jgi:hypothetical protein
MLYAFHKEGLTYGVDEPNADVDIKIDGSQANTTADYNSGKAQAIANNLPSSLLPDATQIHLYNLAPGSAAAGIYFSTLTTMIQQHPDTVQAAVTALTQASEYAITHEAKATSVASTYLAQYGYPDPSEDRVIFLQGYDQFAALSLPTKQAFQDEITEVEFGQGQIVTETWSAFCVDRFAITALKQLHLAFTTNKRLTKTLSYT